MGPGLDRAWAEDSILFRVARVTAGKGLDGSMEGEPLRLSDLSLERVAVDEEQIRAFTSEDDFMYLAVELFKEIGKLTAYLAHACRLDGDGRPRKWTRNEAILGGLCVRLMKLEMGILDATLQKRGEIAQILFRCFFETIVNLEFLIEKGSDSAFDEYVEYSLRTEKKLLDQIEKSIEARGRETSIESRMRRSIMRAFEKSGLAPDQVDESRRTPWGGNIYKRIESVGMRRAYVPGFGISSHAVHGNWQDLITHHVRQQGDGFSPAAEWTRPRPQMMLPAALLAAEACKVYVTEILPECEDRVEILEYIDDFFRRAQLADRMHEQYLQKSAKT